MSGSTFKVGHTVSWNGISTNISNTFINYFRYLLLINRGRITICKFKEYKWKLRHNCSTTTSATAGGGTQSKLPWVKTLSNHPSEFDRVSNSSFSHHDLIHSNKSLLLSNAERCKGQYAINLFSVSTPSELLPLDRAFSPQACILVLEIWVTCKMSSPVICNFLIHNTRPNNILEDEDPL